MRLRPHRSTILEPTLENMLFLLRCASFIKSSSKFLTGSRSLCYFSGSADCHKPFCLCLPFYLFEWLLLHALIPHDLYFLLERRDSELPTISRTHNHTGSCAIRYDLKRRREYRSRARRSTISFTLTT